MKLIKRTLLFFLFITIVVLSFRGWFYRHLIIYKSIGIRENYKATEERLIDYIEISVDEIKNPKIEEIVNVGLEITSKHLNFSFSKNDSDPNKLIITKKAHCVGYASFFATTCNHLLKKYNFNESWVAKPQIGQLYFMGTNIHKYFNSPFLKDHDFVILENKETKEIIAVDPTIYDYFFINLVTYSK
jgi:hypothetical protein